MRSCRGLLSSVSLVVATVSALAIASAAGPAGNPAPALSGPPRPSPKAWTADNGNGTYSNPLFNEEFEDPDVIRVGEDYYLAGTTMHMMPAVMLMHSKDLVNWELAGYCQDKLDLGANYRLENGRGIYGAGIWAPCIRYHEGMFYVFANVNGAGLMVYRSKDIKGPWERNQLPGKHDMSVLFDDDLHKVFLIYGGASPYSIDELAPDLKSVAVPNAHRMQPQGVRMGEGHHLYKIKGKYIDLSATPGGAVNQTVAKADSIDGPWTSTNMVEGESLGISANPARTNAGDRGVWLHQGGMVDTPNGDWWSTIMSDHGSAGRMISLVPITWDDGYPLIGLPGNLRKAPNTWIKPNTGVQQAPSPAFPHDDNFDGPKLNNTWQWNHVEDDTKWSLTEKKGVLRLHSLAAANLYAARDTLCMKPPAPESTMTVELDAAGMKDGDNAGLGIISVPYAWMGLVKSAMGLELQQGVAAAGGRGNRGGGGGAGAGPTITKGPDNPPAHIWLRLHCNFDTDQAQYSWSADGKTFTNLGKSYPTTFQLTTFQGVRPGLYHFNTTGQPGGFADFDNFVCDSPRAAGIERDIPMGKTVELTSGADGSYLAADLANNKLINVAAAGAVPANAKFKVIDVGLGRVELQASDGRVVSVAGPQGAVLKLLGDAKATDSETFQWVNLMRGDTMFMSLTNHKYLATKPNAPGAVTATALGASPARKSGAEFKWKVVE